MDDDNISDLNNLKPNDLCRASVELLGKYDPTGELIIRDPYYVSHNFFVLNKNCKTS